MKRAAAVPSPSEPSDSTTEWYAHDPLNALQAKEYAQRIAFGPSIFQAARTLTVTGLLAALEDAKLQGLTVEEAAARVGLSEYATRVLLEAGLGIGLVLLKSERFLPTKTAHYLLHDELTRVNMEFMHEVNYLGLFDLEEAVRTGRPAGLKRFGEWPTVYQALAHLPDNVRRAWLAFDQFYSDAAFPKVLPLVFKYRPRTLLDIGGNTGKWALACLRHDPTVHVTLADLPGQLALARREIVRAGFAARTEFLELDVLQPNSEIRGHYDAIWMSQFLDCFSDAEVVSILTRARRALAPDGHVFILEPFWDRQRFATAAFCLQQTSLYFTAIANGNSQMYAAGNFLKYLEQAGLKIEEQTDDLGVSHTLLVCR